MPFGRFDAKMKEISELRIVRTWRFDAQDSVFDVE
jgi:protein TonB